MFAVPADAAGQHVQRGNRRARERERARAQNHPMHPARVVDSRGKEQRGRRLKVGRLDDQAIVAGEDAKMRCAERNLRHNLS
jgi:hypothetical protein